MLTEQGGSRSLEKHDCTESFCTSKKSKGQQGQNLLEPLVGDKAASDGCGSQIPGDNGSRIHCQQRGDYSTIFLQC